MSQLKRSLTLTDLTLIAIGSTIGSGIFKTPSKIATALPDPFWIMVIWTLGGFIALTGALTYAELSSAMPESGGIYAYLRKGYGKYVAFLYGWAILTVINTGSMAALATVFADYLSSLLLASPLHLETGNAGRMGIAMGGIALLTAVNLRGAAWGSRFSGVFTFLKILGILIIIVLGITAGPISLPEMIPGDSSAWQKGFFASMGIALVSVLWSYGGWQHASYISAEVKNAERNVPRAMVMGAAAVTLIYILANLAYMKLLSLPDIQGNKAVAATAMQHMFGNAGVILISLLIFISTFGTAGIYTLTAPRIYFAMAEDGIFFKQLAKVDEKTGTPVLAVVLQSAWAILLIAAWGTFENLIDYVVFIEWIFLTLAAGVVILNRMRSPVRPSFTVPLYPLVPAFFILVCSWFVFNTLIEQTRNSVIGLAVVIGAGSLAFAAFRRWGKAKESGQ